MPQSLSLVYVHIIFSTKNRQRSIDEPIENRLFNYLGGTCKGLECYPIEIGGHFDHVHILCSLSRKISQMDLLREVKHESSLWIKSVSDRYSQFYWQDGYGIFSVSKSSLESVRAYIRDQKEHHRRISFKEEFVELLEENGVDYDEKYLWD
jgi:REP element-mobilizing transposase RayT